MRISTALKMQGVREGMIMRMYDNEHEIGTGERLTDVVDMTRW